MTIEQAIEKIDKLKPNQIDDVDKVAWLDVLDRMARAEVIKDGLETEEGYNENTPQDTVLLIPEPYSVVYLHWLAAQIDMVNQEYAKYQNDYILFNSAYRDYAAWHTRTFRPKRTKVTFFRGW